MANPTIVEKICALFVERYADFGRGVAERLRQWLSGAIPYAYPEILDLDRKQDFDQQTVGKLHDALQKGNFNSLEQQLPWLCTEAAKLIPGVDPLPALKAPLAHLCRQWKADFSFLPLCSELENWTRQ